jgi:hypothetical protein
VGQNVLCTFSKVFARFPGFLVGSEQLASALDNAGTPSLVVFLATFA